MALTRAKFRDATDGAGISTALRSDPSLVPQEGIDQSQIESASDRTGIGRIHGVEQLGNKESLIHGDSE
jgi:hypothetical protein